MTKFKTFCCAALAAGSLFACSNELKGEITVDGKAFTLDSCRSGQVYGFHGVEVVSKEGAKIKIMQAPTGEGIAYYIAAGQSTGVELGECGDFTVKTQNSTINDVKNVEGQAKLDCESGGHKVSGSFTYSNCH